jgi:hypothetical protein
MWWSTVLAAGVACVLLLRIAPYQIKFTLYYSVLSFSAVFCVPFFALFDPCDPINC